MLSWVPGGLLDLMALPLGAEQRKPHAAFTKCLLLLSQQADFPSRGKTTAKKKFLMGFSWDVLQRLGICQHLVPWEVLAVASAVSWAWG